MDVFLLALAAIFPVVNPPGAALVFLSLTRHAPASTQQLLARRVAFNSLAVMAGSLMLGRLVLSFYGISVPVLRVAGGCVVAVSGWTLLNQGSREEIAGSVDDELTADAYLSQAFYPLTMPLTTGPGTIAVLVSLGFLQSANTSPAQELRFLVAGLLATAVIAAMIYACFANAGRVERVLGKGGTDIAVRLSAFILFCIGVQIIWSGAAELIQTMVSDAALSRAQDIRSVVRFR